MLIHFLRKRGSERIERDINEEDADRTCASWRLLLQRSILFPCERHRRERRLWRNVNDFVLEYPLNKVLLSEYLGAYFSRMQIPREANFSQTTNASGEVCQKQRHICLTTFDQKLRLRVSDIDKNINFEGPALRSSKAIRCTCPRAPYSRAKKNGRLWRCPPGKLCMRTPPSLANGLLTRIHFPTSVGESFMLRIPHPLPPHQRGGDIEWGFLCIQNPISEGG